MLGPVFRGSSVAGVFAIIRKEGHCHLWTNEPSFPILSFFLLQSKTSQESFKIRVPQHFKGRCWANWGHFVGSLVRSTSSVEWAQIPVSQILGLSLLWGRRLALQIRRYRSTSAGCSSLGIAGTYTFMSKSLAPSSRTLPLPCPSGTGTAHTQQPRTKCRHCSLTQRRPRMT